MCTHLVICKNSDTLQFLKREELIIGFHSEKGIPVGQGDALVARDELIEAGFEWGKDFYIKKVEP